MIRLRRIALAGIVLAACQPTATIGRHDPSTTSGSGTDAGATAGPSGTTMGAAGSTTMVIPDVPFDPHAACDPNPDDSTCLQCTREQCCDEVVACVEDPGCRCLIDCFDDAWVPDYDCSLRCRPDTTLLQPLVQCQIAHGCASMETCLP